MIQMLQMMMVRVLLLLKAVWTQMLSTMILSQIQTIIHVAMLLAVQMRRCLIITLMRAWMTTRVLLLLRAVPIQ